jgi:hypothetical protein
MEKNNEQCWVTFGPRHRDGARPTATKRPNQPMPGTRHGCGHHVRARLGRHGGTLTASARAVSRQHNSPSELEGASGVAPVKSVGVGRLPARQGGVKAELRFGAAVALHSGVELCTSGEGIWVR